MASVKKEESWRRQSMSLDDDFDDGELFEEARNSKNPNFLDFGTWKRQVGGLVRSESHVLLENDEHLREAIEQAMFLEMASENLMKKRQKQLDLLDDFRAKEGETARKLFSEVRPVLQKNFGPIFDQMERDVTQHIARSKLPIQKPLDTSRPPPRPFAHELPPLHIPPPPFSNFAPTRPPPQLRIEPFSTPPKPRPLEYQEFAATPKPPMLMAQHLLPPAKVEEKEKNVTEGATRDDSWRKPYHPTPLPPPAPFRFGSPSGLKVPSFRGTFGRNNDSSAPPIPPLLTSPLLSPPPQLSTTTRGRVGINVKGLFMGGGSLKRHNSTSSSSGNEGAPIKKSN